MSDRAPYSRVYWTIREADIWGDDRQLAAWLRDTIASEAVARASRRPHLPVRVWRAILDRYGHRCAYCGASGVPLEREHRIPFSRGGATDDTNIVPACLPCNRIKYVDEWQVAR
jgi:5-methylcytosine-specific restriction endonuclease McrA